MRDPEVVTELSRHPEGPPREGYALSALRVGVLALRGASGSLDAGAIRAAGDRVVHGVERLLDTRARDLFDRLASTVDRLFDPRTGVIPQRLEALTRPGGEIERLLRTQIGPEDSILARTLSKHLGAGSPILERLSPDHAEGVRAQVQGLVEKALTDQRDRILAEFSLDRPESALARLVGSLTLDDERSSLSRLKRALEEAVERVARTNVEFQSEVRATLAATDARKRTEAGTPRHGLAFEAALGRLLAETAQGFGDLYEDVTAKTGLIARSKVGDHVVTIGPEGPAPGERIVWEAKEAAGYDVARVLAEIEQARKNRGAQIGVFVLSRRCAPETLAPLVRYGDDVVVTWDAEDPATDLLVQAAYSLARALLARRGREAAGSAEAAGALVAIERAARAVERQAGHLAQIATWGETTKSTGEKIVARSRKMEEDLRGEVVALDRAICDLKGVGHVI